MNLRRKQTLKLALLTILTIVTLAAVNGCAFLPHTKQNITVKDTVIVTKQRVLHDTLTIQKDTIIYQDRVKVEIKWLKGEKVFINAECPTDTVRVEKIKIVNQKIKKERLGWQFFAGWGITILFLLVIVRELIRKAF
tara:strand:+ start:829 stop:1239 length:411 start_codon:yes stop_codon:yes gene_type:complete